MPSPAGKVTELARSDEEKNGRRTEKGTKRDTAYGISSSDCSFVAATFPAGEGKTEDPFTGSNLKGGTKAHLCAATRFRAMQENEIPPVFAGDIYLN